MGFPGDSVVTKPSAVKKMQVQSLGQKDPLEKEIATHTSIFALEIPWTKEPNGLQSRELQESDMTEQLNHHYIDDV